MAEPQLKRRRFVGRPSIYAWRVVVSMHISKESERFFSVRAVALPNLPQTFRGRERSKKGYANCPLVVTNTVNFGDGVKTYFICN